MATIQERKRKDGKKTYTATIRIKGSKPMTATFDRLTDAKLWIADNESRIRLGKHIKEAEAKKHTLGEVIDRYITTVLPQKGINQQKYAMQLNWWKDKLGYCLLSDLTPSKISEYKELLINEPSPKSTKKKIKRSGSTANRYLACLSSVLTTACREWEWIEENPVLKVSKYKEPKGRTRFLSKEEQDKLLSVAKNMKNNYIFLLIVLALSTGARLNEITTLKWKNIIFNKDESVTLIFCDTKNGDDRSATITGLGYDLLKQHSKVRQINSSYLFARPDGLKPMDMYSSWKSARKQAGLKNFRFHDLRHTTASNLAMNGASLLDIAEILGHKTLQMVQRYAHLTKKHSTDILKKLNDKQFKEYYEDNKNENSEYTAENI